MTQPLTMPHAVVITMTFGFTGWLIERGHEPHAALLITLGSLAGAVVVPRASWHGALAVVRRLTSTA